MDKHVNFLLQVSIYKYALDRKFSWIHHISRRENTPIFISWHTKQRVDMSVASSNYHLTQKSETHCGKRIMIVHCGQIILLYDQLILQETHSK